MEKFVDEMSRGGDIEKEGRELVDDLIALSKRPGRISKMGYQSCRESLGKAQHSHAERD